jgi:4-hydroxy-4-methyl-2-oxoglutarate aldolase
LTVKGRSNTVRISIVCACMLGLQLLGGCSGPSEVAPPSDPLLEAYGSLSTAAISDAMDQIAGKRAFLSHDVRPIYTSHIVGRAVTVLLRHVDALTDEEKALTVPNAVARAIDEAGPGDVLVVTAQDGPSYSSLDVSVIGGLSGTAAKLRGLEGAVIDGGIRDLQELRDMRFPVFTRSVVPASTVGRYIGVSDGQPILCAGIMVNPHDIIVGDEDGVVVVPDQFGKVVLDAALEVDRKEKMTVPLIREFKSLGKAIQPHGPR